MTWQCVQFYVVVSRNAYFPINTVPIITFISNVIIIYITVKRQKGRKDKRPRSPTIVNAFCAACLTVFHILYLPSWEVNSGSILNSSGRFCAKALMSWSSKTGSISSTPENVTLNSAIILPGLTKRRRKSMIVALFLGGGCWKIFIY